LLIRPALGEERDARLVRVRRLLADHPRLRWLGRKRCLISGQRGPLHPASEPYPPRADPFATRSPIGLLPSPARDGRIFHACRKDTIASERRIVVAGSQSLGNRGGITPPSPPPDHSATASTGCAPSPSVATRLSSRPNLAARTAGTPAPASTGRRSARSSPSRFAYIARPTFVLSFLAIRCFADRPWGIRPRRADATFP